MWHFFIPLNHAFHSIQWFLISIFFFSVRNQFHISSDKSEQTYELGGEKKLSEIIRKWYYRFPFGTFRCYHIRLVLYLVSKIFTILLHIQTLDNDNNRQFPLFSIFFRPIKLWSGKRDFNNIQWASSGIDSWIIFSIKGSFE